MQVVVSEAEKREVGTPLGVLSMKDGTPILCWMNGVEPEKIADCLRALGINPAKVNWIKPDEGVSL